MANQIVTGQSSKEFTQFLVDVQQVYTYSSSKIDENNNFVITIETKSLMFPASGLYSRYEEFKKSALPYKSWVTRTAGYITNEAKKWYNSWH